MLDPEDVSDDGPQVAGAHATVDHWHFGRILMKFLTRESQPRKISSLLLRSRGAGQ